MYQRSDTPCEHYVEASDENFLLDDENAKQCVTCRKQIELWPVDETQWSPINGAFHKSLDDHIEDHHDNLEDSPLLINDCYTEPDHSDFHCHDSVTVHEDVNAWKKLVSASVFCLIFMVAEIVGGYIAGSLAVMTDAAHLFSDFVGFIISLLAIWVGRKTPTKYMTFGYHRAEVLGALLSVLTIWILAVVFFGLAIDRLYRPDYEIDANTMIIVAVLGLLVNISMGIILHGTSCSGHSHSHSHGHTHSPPNSNDNINVRAAAAHVLGDLLQSVGVLIAAIIIKIYPSAKIADPICTLIFSIIVLFSTFRVGKDSLWFLIEGSPVDSGEVQVELRKLPGVKHVHNLHIWTLAPGKDAVNVHLAVDNYCDRDLVVQKAMSIIKSQISLVTCTVQVEAFNSNMIISCKHCQMIQC